MRQWTMPTAVVAASMLVGGSVLAQEAQQGQAVQPAEEAQQQDVPSQTGEQAQDPLMQAEDQAQDPLQTGEAGEEPALHEGSQMADEGAPMGLDGEAIRELQQALADAGHDPGEPDGIWGEQTAAAVREFQQAQDLDANGDLDEQTLAALGLDHLGSDPAEPAAGADQSGMSEGSDLGTEEQPQQQQ